MIRAAIDVSPLLQTRAGTARYLRGLLRELRLRGDVELDTHSFGRNTRASTLLRDGIWYPLLLGRDEEADVLHCPTYRGPVHAARPVVVTVHDLAVLRHPDAFNRWSRLYGPRVVPRVLRNARLVIAVSEFTRRELHLLLDLDDEKIRVIPNAVEPLFTNEGLAASGDYVLTVGTLEPRKNLARLVKATKHAGVELRVVGARGWGNVAVNGSGVHWLGEVDDAKLAELYRGALCLAYPSLYEGFGIPVLEAMACGTPVVTTRGSAMEEVADGAAVLVDPEDPSDIAAGIERAVAQRRELAALGLERAHAFRWDAVAGSTVAVYREATS